MLIFLLIILFPVCEIYLLYKFTEAFNLWLVFAYLGMGMWVGSILLKFQGRSVLGKLQNEILLNRKPQKALIKNLFFALAGVLFFLPGFISDILALMLLFPPTQWLIIRFTQNWLLSLFKNGRFKVFTQNAGPFSGNTANQNGFEESTIDSRLLEENLETGLDVTSLKDVTPKK